MILKLAAEFRPMVWGSENWVISGYGERETRVAEGPLAGKTLNEVYGEQFPLLIKFIDAHDDLSLQVHPDDALAAARGIGLGKTEMWYVMNHGGHLLVGLKEQITPDSYASLVKENRLVDVLERHDTAPGDVFFLPAGRIHAICGGTLLCEIQETSDNTYRIYDYGRLGLDGKPRQLHIEESKDAIDYKVYPSYRTDYPRELNRETVVVRDPHFTTSVFDLDSPVSVNPEGCGRFVAVMCVEGEGSVDGAPIKSGEALLVLDHDAPFTLTPAEGSKVKFLTTHE